MILLAPAAKSYRNP